jgi:ABC transporter substrate binding protein
MTERRGFIMATGVALTAMPRALRAQPRKSARIGWVGSWYSQSVGALLFDSFRQGMRELGYVEGQNLTIEARWLEGTVSPHEEAAKATAELLRSKVDILVAQGTTIPGVKGAAGSTPVVFVYSGDPVEAKLGASLARPGGNLTGMTVFDVELGGKQLELLKEAIPRLSRVGVLANPLHIGEYPELQRSQAVAQRLGLRLQQALVRTIPEVNPALETMGRERVQALMVFPNLLTPESTTRDRRCCSQSPNPHDIWLGGFRGRWELSHNLRPLPSGGMALRRDLRRQDPQRRATRRSPRGATHQVVPRHQSQGGEGSGRHYSSFPPGPCGSNS